MLPLPVDLAGEPSKNLPILLSALARAQQLATSWLTRPPQQLPSDATEYDTLADLDPTEELSFDDQVRFRPRSSAPLNSLAAGKDSHPVVLACAASPKQPCLPFLT